MLDLNRCRRLLPTTAHSVSDAALDALLTQLMTIAEVGSEPLNFIRGTTHPETESKTAPKRNRTRKSRSLSFRQLLMAVPQRDRETVIERAAILEYDGSLERKVAENIALSEWGQRRLEEGKKDAD